jgi:hypothetical protein
MQRRQPLIETPLDIHLCASRRSRARHDALGPDPIVTGKLLDGFVDDIDDVLASHPKLHRAAGAANALDAERA